MHRAVVAALALAACAPSPACPQPTSSSGGDASAEFGNVQGARPRARGAPVATVPGGFLLAQAEAVVPTAEGDALLLSDPTRTRMVPVMIGAAEANAISMRLRGERFSRPLTHDLLDTVIAELGGTVVMVQVDKLRSGVFVGSIFLWDGSAMHRIDARTSDAVAVAIGQGVPIYVSTGVFDEAGIDASGLPPRR